MRWLHVHIKENCRVLWTLCIVAKWHYFFNVCLWYCQKNFKIIRYKKNVTISFMSGERSTDTAYDKRDVNSMSIDCLSPNDVCDHVTCVRTYAISSARARTFVDVGRRKYPGSNHLLFIAAYRPFCLRRRDTRETTEYITSHRGCRLRRRPVDVALADGRCWNDARCHRFFPVFVCVQCSSHLPPGGAALCARTNSDWSVKLCFDVSQTQDRCMRISSETHDTFDNFQHQAER